MGYHQSKYKVIHVRLYDIKKFDNHLLLKCQPYDLILNYSNKHYYHICKHIKVGHEYKFYYYPYLGCSIVHKLL